MSNIRLLKDEVEQGRLAVIDKQRALQSLLDQKSRRNLDGEPYIEETFNPAIDAARASLQHEEANQRDRERSVESARSGQRANIALAVSIASLVATAVQAAFKAFG